LLQSIGNKTNYSNYSNKVSMIYPDPTTA